LKGWFKSVAFVAIYSSRYTPKESTLRIFEGAVTWKRVGELYAKESSQLSLAAYQRADAVYGR
jgi:hypothetical protein